jgi:hypothetical protein
MSARLLFGLEVTVTAGAFPSSVLSIANVPSTWLMMRYTASIGYGAISHGEADADRLLPCVP